MSAYPSLISPLMNAQGLITTSALNTEAQTALAAAVAADAKADTLLATALQTSGQNYTGLPDAGIVLKDNTDTITFSANGNSGDLSVKGVVSAGGFANTNSSFQVNDLGNCTVNELTYTTLNPPIVPGATPSLSQVLAVSGDGGNKPITNVENLYVNNVINTAVRIETNQVSILNDGGTGYHIMDSNVSGVDLNTKFTSDGLILHKVATGSDITIQNDATNLVTLGTTAGYADLQVGILNYLELNPPIVPSATPTLAEVLEAGNDGGDRGMIGLTSLTVNSAYQIIKDADHPELGAISLSSDTVGFTTGDVPLTANTLIGSSLDGIAFQNTDASFKANFDGSVDCGNITCELVNSVAPQFKPTYTYFVSKGGNDTEGLGSILSPYLTIQKAISVCEAVYDGVPRVVNVAAGSYVENLTLAKSRISIVGQGQSSRPDVGTSITGTITITIASGNSDLNNNNIYWSNFLINGLVEDNTASTSYPHRVFFDRCQLYASNRVLYLHPAGDYRAFVSNCVISNDNTAATDPIVECYSSSTGMVSFTTNQITSKGASQNVFKLSGSCRIDTYAQNILTSDSVGDNVAIAIFVHNSTATITLGQNAFVYSSVGAKRNADTASGIYMNAASAGGSLVIANNIFSLTGLPTGQHAVQNNSAGGVVIYGSNISTSSAAGTSAHDISGSNNTTKFAMTSVQ